MVDLGVKAGKAASAGHGATRGRSGRAHLLGSLEAPTTAAGAPQGPSVRLRGLGERDVQMEKNSRSRTCSWDRVFFLLGLRLASGARKLLSQPGLRKPQGGFGGIKHSAEAGIFGGPEKAILARISSRPGLALDLEQAHLRSARL